MVRTIIVEELGGPQVMRMVDHDPGRPGPGEVRIRHDALGVNFADIHYRRGTAPKHSMDKLPMPFTPGLEGVGHVEEIGAGVATLRPGDRVAYASSSLTTGAYADARLYPADRCFVLPDSIAAQDAAAMLYKAITVQGMIRQCYSVKAGDTILLHAAAGGIGTILSQWARHLGATVIGTVSAASKVERALANGCAHVIVNAEEDFVARTLKITEGRGVDVCFDGVGISVFTRSLAAIRRYGMMVSFGQASGLVEPLDPIELQFEGLYLTKFSGSTYNEYADEYQARAKDVVEAIAAGVFALGTQSTYGLDEVIRAHEDLEAQRVLGSLVLVP